MKKVIFIVALISFLFSCTEHNINKEVGKKRDTIGIDISSCQEIVNWNQVKTDPNYLISFVILRATMGDDRKDKRFISNFNGAKEAKIKVGTYHFFDLKEDGKKQADNYLKSISKISSDFPPIVDIEVFKYVKHIKIIKKTIMIEKKNKKGIVLKNKKKD